MCIKVNNLMKQKIFLSLILLPILFFNSCKEKNEDFSEDVDKGNGFPNIAIDSLKYTYISAENNYFYKGFFKSREHILNFNLKLQENRKYRVSSSRKFYNKSDIKLTLYSGSNPITNSQDIDGNEVLYFNSSNYQDLILKANLQDQLNISLDYKLYFEEMAYDTLNFSNYQFSYYGHFTDSIADTCKYYPSESSWYRWLRLNNNIAPSKNSISYSFKLENSNYKQNFGFVISGDSQLSSDNDFENNLPNGYTFLVEDNKYTILKIETASVLILEEGILNQNIDFSQAIDIIIKKNDAIPENKEIYINNNLVSYIVCDDFNYFYMLFSDKAESKVNIFNFKIE